MRNEFLNDRLSGNLTHARESMASFVTGDNTTAAFRAWLPASRRTYYTHGPQQLPELLREMNAPARRTIAQIATTGVNDQWVIVVAR